LTHIRGSGRAVDFIHTDVGCDGRPKDSDDVSSHALSGQTPPCWTRPHPKVKLCTACAFHDPNTTVGREMMEHNA